MAKIERKYMAHYIDANFVYPSTSTPPHWYWMGDDLEEFSVEMNPIIETTQNMLGDAHVDYDGYEMSAEAETFYARTDDPLFESLQSIIDDMRVGDACTTYLLEVHLWEPVRNGYVAYRQLGYVIPTSYGGDSSGYQIPFSITYFGDKVRGVFVPGGNNGGTFTVST